VGELTAQFAVSQPAVSQHLAVLKRCGLVRERREGRFAHYRGRPEGLGTMVEWLGHFRKFWPEKLEGQREMVEGWTGGVERLWLVR
jgi:DNA-binding transcriptional ArsR family regulator